MPAPDPSIDFSPFVPGFRFNPGSPIVQGMERLNPLHPSLHPELLPWLQEELHIPQDRDIIMFEQWCPLGRKGYFFELVGTYALADDPPDAPRFSLINPPLNRPQGYTARDEHTYALDMPPLIAWRRRVIYQHGPLWIEARWHPATGESLALRGLEKDLQLPRAPQAYKNIAFLKDLAPHTYQSITLLKAIEVAAGGRPPGTRYYSRDQFHARYPGAVADATKRRREHVNDEAIARAFPLSLSTFYRYIRDYGRPPLF